jgi:DNA-binding response OmpR family regulator
MAGSSARVLCVDDDAGVLERLREFLVDRGYEVCAARSAAEATDVVKRWTPRAAIVNPLVPPADGIGVIERVRRLNPGMLVLLLTKPLDPILIERSLAEAGLRPAPRGRALPPDPECEPTAVRKRVLVVDDEVDIREILAEYLRGRGFDVAQAAGGEEALAVIPVFLPHLVLLDLSMPGLDGLATLRRIKALPVETAVVIISANDEVELGQLTLAIGAAGYVPKPVDFDYLDAAMGSPCSAGTGSPAAPGACPLSGQARPAPRAPCARTRPARTASG